MSVCDICGKATGVLRMDLMLVQALCCNNCYRDYKEEEAEAFTYYEDILSNYKEEDRGEVNDGFDK
jgi:hypothetical protein